MLQYHAHVWYNRVQRDYLWEGGDQVAINSKHKKVSTPSGKNNSLKRTGTPVGRFMSP
jgi:hypothetical protein